MRDVPPAAVHPFARTGFGRAAGAYGRARPNYPEAAVAWLVEALASGLVGPFSTSARGPAS